LVHRCVGIRSNVEEILGHVPVVQVDGVVQRRLALSLDATVIRQDCLCYVMERIDPVQAAASA
ncbi:MAG: hypothetical protein PHF72_15205, partial [Gammaproteobacteria bacterium]|nr:hypothetical protein [Gammaproteobacteria bacterium]